MSLTRRILIPIILVVALGTLGCQQFVSTGPYHSHFPRSQCNGVLYGQLIIQHMETDVPDLWCWATTTSEVLKWYRLPHSEACEVYDLVNGTTTCQDKVDPRFPCNNPNNPNTCWYNLPNNNNSGDAADAARTYQAVYPVINVTESTYKPLEFYQIQQKICPADGSLGSPFIFVYQQSSQFDHDVVVYGFSFINLGNPRANIFGRFLYVHDPNNEWDPRVIDYDGYRSVYWVEDVFIWTFPERWLIKN